MGLLRFKPLPSGRMGILWTLVPIRDAALVEFGCMGHLRYSRMALTRAGVLEACKSYSTHIEETDITMGETKRLTDTIADVIERDNPKVIFLQPSSIPEVIGTDLPALVAELQPEYPGVRLVPFGYGGFDVTQYRGVQEALLQLVKALPVDTKRTQKPTFNIIGSCADLYHYQADTNEILRMMEGAFGMKPVCVLSSDTSIAEIEKMGGAHINLAIRREGEPAAKHLKERFGAPYIAARPYGIEGTARWIREIERISGLTADAAFLGAEQATAWKMLEHVPSLGRGGGWGHGGGGRRGGGGRVRGGGRGNVLSLGGHADVVKGILDFGCGELSLAKGVCWCDSPDMGSADIPYFSEEEWVQAVESHENGCLMASGEALELAGLSPDLQISNPGSKWQLYPYEPPFVGFRGAMYLMHLWVNNLERYR